MYLNNIWYILRANNPFSLRHSVQASILFIMLLTIGASWFAVMLSRAWAQQKAIATIEEAGGFVFYDYQQDSSGNICQGPQPPVPRWIRSLMGDDFFQDVVAVEVTTNEELASLKIFPQLHTLVIDASRVTDDGLNQIEQLPQLTDLFISGPGVTDRGLEHMKYLTNLRRLGLPLTNITDNGLNHLSCLSQLRELNIHYTKVTDHGINNLRQSIPNCIILKEDRIIREEIKGAND
jgi:hypothetical protein